MSAQAERAIAEADVILLVVDVTVGLTDRGPRRGPAPEAVGPPGPGGGQQGRLGPAREPTSGTALSLGLGDPWPVSALHGRGTGDLLDEVVPLLPEPSRRPVRHAVRHRRRRR